MSAPPAWLAAALQLSSTADVVENLGCVERGVRRAAERGARLVVLPENFAFQGDETHKRRVAERIDAHDQGRDGPIVASLRRLAVEHSLHLVGGGMPEASDDAARPYNCSVHLGPDGRVLARYRKLHLFDVDAGDGHAYRESAGTMAGDDVVCTEVDGASLGMSICYDVRFAELYRAMGGVRVITVPAAFTLMTGKDHWQVLLRARAIENQAFVVAPAQYGRHPDTGRVTHGKSMIVDPWGDVLAQAPDGQGAAVAELDFARQDQLRRAMPVAAHRRLGANVRAGQG